MENIQSAVNNFLKKHGIYPSDIDLSALCDVFIDEMDKGLNGQESSLMMIPTYIRIEESIPVNEPVIVIDAGGTNLRTALVHFDNDKNCVIEHFSNYPMPGSRGEISKQIFFETVYQYIEPLLKFSDKIGFCFSYATEISPDKDGKVIGIAKEVRVTDLVGEYLGKNLLTIIQTHDPAAKKSIILLNDTVATLIGGKTAYPNRVFDNYFALILGTGYNTCYSEKCENIGKLRPAADPIPNDSMLINMESGIFSKAPSYDLFDAFDRTTVKPGDHLFEKAVSGAYQGVVFLAILKQAAADGLFSPSACAKLAALPALSSKELDEFLYVPHGENTLAQCCDGTTDDAQIIFYLIDAFMERIAMLITVNITAMLKATGYGKNPCLPVCVAAEGTTFYKSKLIRGKLDYYAKAFTNEVHGLYFEYTKAENAVLAGTAIAALQNC